MKNHQPDQRLVLQAGMLNCVADNVRQRHMAYRGCSSDLCVINRVVIWPIAAWALTRVMDHLIGLWERHYESLAYGSLRIVLIRRTK